MAGISKTVTTLLSDATVAANSESTLASCTELDLNAAIQVEIEVVLTYGATATKGAVARVWAAAVSGTYTTAPIDEYTLPFTAGATVRISFQTRASPRYIKVTIKNTDTAVGVSAVTVKSTAQTVV